MKTLILKTIAFSTLIVSFGFMPKQVMALQKVSPDSAPLCINDNNSCLNPSFNQSNIYIISEKTKPYKPKPKGDGTPRNTGNKGGGGR